VKASAIGALLYRATTLQIYRVGDWVAVQAIGTDEAMIHAVLLQDLVLPAGGGERGSGDDRR